MLGQQPARSCQSTLPLAGCLSDWLPPEPVGLTGCHGDYESQSCLGTGPEPSELQLQLIEKPREECSREKRDKQKSVLGRKKDESDRNVKED